MHIEPACGDLPCDKFQNKRVSLHKDDDLLKAQTFFLCQGAFKVECHKPEKFRSISDSTDFQYGEAVLRRLMPCCDYGIISAVDDAAQFFGQPVSEVIKHKQHSPVAAYALESLQLAFKVFADRFAVLP